MIPAPNPKQMQEDFQVFSHHYESFDLNKLIKIITEHLSYDGVILLDSNVGSLLSGLFTEGFLIVLRKRVELYEKLENFANLHANLNAQFAVLIQNEETTTKDTGELLCEIDGVETEIRKVLNELEDERFRDSSKSAQT